MLKSFLSSGFIATSILTITSTAMAEVSTQLAVGYEIGSYDIESNIDMEADISMLTLSGSLFYDNGFYAKISHGTSEEDEWMLDGFTVPLGHDIEETTITFGKMVDGVSYMVGYQTKTTDFEQIAEIEVGGLFIGASKSYEAGAGSFYFSGALALMGADINFDDGDTLEADMAFGFSLGAGYSQAISDNLVLSASLKYQSYTLDYDIDTEGEEESELFLRYGISLGYNF